MEKQKSFSPEEIGELQKSRALSDAKLLEKGAEYEVASNGAVELHPTDEQKKHAHKEMERERKAIADKTKEELLQEKDPQRFSDAYSDFIMEVHDWGRDIRSKGGHIDQYGQVIASKKRKEEARDEMNESFLKSKEKGSKEYIEAAEHFRKKTGLETEEVVLSDGTKSTMATENQKNIAKREMYDAIVNTMSDSEYLLTLPLLLKPGVLESFEYEMSESSNYCCELSRGEYGEVCYVRKLNDNDNFIGKSCSGGDDGSHGMAIFLHGGRKVVEFSFHEIQKELDDSIEYKDVHIAGLIKSGKKHVLDVCRKLLKKRFQEEVAKQGFSAEQVEMMLQIK